MALQLIFLMQTGMRKELVLARKITKFSSALNSTVYVIMCC